MKSSEFFKANTLHFYQTMNVIDHKIVKLN